MLVGVQVCAALDGCPGSGVCPWVGVDVPGECPSWVSPVGEWVSLVGVAVCVYVFVPGECPGGFCGSCHFLVLRRAGSVGGWSARGCEVAFRNQSHVSCQCHHLTSFAVLMDISHREVGTQGDTEGCMGAQGDRCDTWNVEGHSDPGGME